MRNAPNNVQHHIRESVKVNLVPLDTGDNALEETVYRPIFMTRHEVTPYDLHACHWLKNSDEVILKFKDRELKTDCSMFDQENFILKYLSVDGGNLIESNSGNLDQSFVTFLTKVNSTFNLHVFYKNISKQKLKSRDVSLLACKNQFTSERI